MKERRKKGERRGGTVELNTKETKIIGKEKTRGERVQRKENPKIMNLKGKGRSS